MPEAHLPVHLINPESYLIKRCLSSCGNFPSESSRDASALLLLREGGRTALLGRKFPELLKAGRGERHRSIPLEVLKVGALQRDAGEGKRGGA